MTDELKHYLRCAYCDHEIDYVDYPDDCPVCQRHDWEEHWDSA